ncbi:MAG: efflux RND transporter periplasmic adaptor subunit [Spirochaetes bacterium]|nr:efflux RND transporter periplasmic adaptor subunit [Spirochaetota bacterium]
MKRTVIIIIIVAVAALAIYRIGVFVNKTIKSRADVQTDKRVPVRGAAIGRMDMVEKLKLTGDIKGEDAVMVYSHVPGKVEVIAVREGQRVVKNQVMFKINRDVVGMEYLPAPVESPITGYVGSIMVDRGSSIAPTVPLAQVVNMNNVEAVVHLIEEDMQRIQIGMRAEVTVQAYPDRVFRGTIIKKSAVLDIASRTQDAIIRLPNPGMALRHGMFASVTILVKSRGNVLAAPVDSIMTDEKGVRFVYKIAKERAVKQPVTTGIVTDEYAEVTVGLAAGDRIITLGQENVSPGDTLLVYYDDKQSGGGLMKPGDVEAEGK